MTDAVELASVNSNRRIAASDTDASDPPVCVPEAKIAASLSNRLAVLMLGPSLEVMGGISSVERLILQALPAHIRAEHIATMKDGTAFTKVRTFAAALVKTWRALARRPDVVHIHFASGASSVRKEVLARMALLRGTKVILHAHGAQYRLYWARINERQRARTLAVLRRVHLLIVLGERWREFFVGIGVPPHKIVVLPNPVRLPAAIPARAHHGVVTAVYLGIMGKRKGTYDLLNAVRQLPQATRTKLRLVMAGNGEVDRVRELVQSYGLSDCIDVRDWLSAEQRDALLACGEIFVLPSYNEGLPMAMLEAMSWELAPICTPVGSIAEVIRHEDNGLLVPPGDTGALASALHRLVEDRGARLTLAQNARRSVEPLSVDRYMTRLAQVYSQAARVQSAEERG